MNNYEFLGYLYINPLSFLFILLINAVINYSIFKNYVHTIFDPLFLTIFLTTFAQAVVFFLFLTNNIKFNILFNFCLSEIAFLAGLFFFNYVKTNNYTDKREFKKYKIKNERYLSQIFFIVSSIIFVFSQLYVYSVKGIPILMETRLDVYSEGSGFGVLSRLLAVSGIITLYMIFYFFFVIKKSKLKILYYIMFFIILTSYLFGGSKSEFLNIPFVFFTFSIFNDKSNTNNFFSYIKKYQFKIILIGIFFSLIIIMVQTRNNSSPDNPLFTLIYRFLDTGSIYWYAYPNETYKIINNTNGFKVLFTDFLGLLRIFRWDEFPENGGLLLVKYHHPEIGDLKVGPNMRHNVFGLIYFGFYWSILFSFFIGITIGFIRNLLHKLLPNNLFFGLLFTLLYLNCATLGTDPQVVLSFLNNVLLFFPIISLIVFLIFFGTMKSPIIFHNNISNASSYRD